MATYTNQSESAAASYSNQSEASPATYDLQGEHGSGLIWNDATETWDQTPETWDELAGQVWTNQTEN